MFFTISGRFQIRSSSGDPARVSDGLAHAFRSAEGGRVERSGNCLSYRRGYDLFIASRSPLKLFDPGEVCVEQSGDSLIVRYRLGLSPLAPMLLVPLVGLCALLFIPSARPEVPALAGLLGALVFAVVTYSLLSFHVWLKRVVTKLL